MGFKDYLRGEEGGTVPKKTKKKSKKTNNYDKFLEKKRLKLMVGGKSRNIEIARPRDFSDIERLIDKMRSSDGIIVDFSSNTAETAQRMLDFLSGAVYAFCGEVSRIEDATYLMTPKGVRIVVSLAE